MDGRGEDSDSIRRYPVLTNPISLPHFDFVLIPVQVKLLWPFRFTSGTLGRKLLQRTFRTLPVLAAVHRKGI